jgi:hypothetical protein
LSEFQQKIDVTLKLAEYEGSLAQGQILRVWSALGTSLRDVTGTVLGGAANLDHHRPEWSAELPGCGEEAAWRKMHLVGGAPPETDRAGE